MIVHTESRLRLLHGILAKNYEQSDETIPIQSVRTTLISTKHEMLFLVLSQDVIAKGCHELNT